MSDGRSSPQSRMSDKTQKGSKLAPVRELRRSLEMQIASRAYPNVDSIQKLDCRQVAVVIPAYNEERFIGSVILRAQKLASTIIVVDDGSTDATAEIAKAAGAVVMRHEHNQGKGVALNTGFRYVRRLGSEMTIT